MAMFLSWPKMSVNCRRIKRIRSSWIICLISYLVMLPPAFLQSARLAVSLILCPNTKQGQEKRGMPRHCEQPKNNALQADIRIQAFLLRKRRQDLCRFALHIVLRLGNSQADIVRGVQ